MKLLAFFLSLFFVAMPAAGLSTADYYSLAPELLNTINNAWALIYTVSTGSFIAFYLFGWSAGWLIRIFGFVVFFVFLDEAVSGFAAVVKTLFEAQILYIASTNICALDEAASFIYQSVTEPAFCNVNPDIWSQLSVSHEGYKEIVKGYAGAYAELGLIGEGHSMASQTRNGTGENIGFLFWKPANGAVCLLSVLIWILVPPKEFFIKKGWIKS